MALARDVVVEGQALETFGLQVDGEISGIGLVTFGFLWPGIWSPCDFGIATSWGACGATITTVWTDCD